MRVGTLDILLILNVCVSVLALALSAVKSRNFFRKVIAAASLLQIGTGVFTLVAFARLQGAGVLLSTVAGYMSAGAYATGWLVTLVTFALFAAVSVKILPPQKRGFFPAYSLHRFALVTTALVAFVAFPLAWVLSSETFTRPFQTASLLGIGYVAVFLRIDLVRTLALSSFAHRNFFSKDPTAPGTDGKAWNWWAFLFGVRWYFSKGLLKPGWLMMIPYVLAFLPGMPPALLLLAPFGTRIYCGLCGNRDYLKMKGASSRDFLPN